MSSIQAMVEESPRMKALSDFLAASPRDSDRKWAEYIALAPDLAGFLNPKRDQTRVSSSSASSTTRSTTSPCVLSSAAATHEFSPMRGTTEDKPAAPASTASLHAPSSAVSTATLAAATSASTSTCLTRLATFSTATASSAPCSAVSTDGIMEPAFVTGTPETDLSSMMPTTCSAECPSHDTSVHAAAPATPKSSTTTGGVVPELPVPEVTNKSLDMDAMVDIAPMASICLPGGPDHSTGGEHPEAMSLNSWSAPAFFVPPQDTCVLMPEFNSPLGCHFAATQGNALQSDHTLTPWPSFNCSKIAITLVSRVDSEQWRQLPYLVSLCVRVTSFHWLRVLFVQHVRQTQPPWPPPELEMIGWRIKEVARRCTYRLDIAGRILLLHPLGNLLSSSGSISSNDMSSSCLKWSLDDVLVVRSDFAICDVSSWQWFTLMHAELQFQVSCTLTSFALKVQCVQLQLPRFTWSDFYCLGPFSLIASTNVDKMLDSYSQRQTDCTLWTWYYTDNLQWSPGSTNWTISHWKMLMTVNCDLWTITVQQSTSFVLFLASLDGRAELYHHLQGLLDMALIEWKAWTSAICFWAIHTCSSACPNGIYFRSTHCLQGLHSSYDKFPRYLWQIPWCISPCYPIPTSIALFSTLPLLDSSICYKSQSVPENATYLGSHRFEWQIPWSVAWLQVDPSYAHSNLGKPRGLILQIIFQTRQLQPTKIICCSLLFQWLAVITTVLPVGDREVHYAEPLMLAIFSLKHWQQLEEIVGNTNLVSVGVSGQQSVDEYPRDSFGHSFSQIAIEETHGCVLFLLRMEPDDGYWTFESAFWFSWEISCTIDSEFRSIVKMVSKYLCIISNSLELNLLHVDVWSMLCSRFRPLEATFLQVDMERRNNKDVSSWNSSLPCSGHVQLDGFQGVFLDDCITVSCYRFARSNELTHDYTTDGIGALFRAKKAWDQRWVSDCDDQFHEVFSLSALPPSKALLLPWDPGDYFASTWCQNNPGRLDDTCYCPSVDSPQVPWDPGGLEQHRLGGKPKFKKGGLSATFFSTLGPDSKLTLLGLSLLRTYREGCYKYRRRWR